MGVDTGAWDENWGSVYVPTQTTGGQGSNSGTGTNWAAWYPWVNLALEGVNTYAGYTAAKDANRKNIQLQREQQAWEKSMSDSAVQRRADDIEKAGGNRALAFTNGQSASTPSVASAQVEPNYRPEWSKGMGASSMLMAAQLDNLRANTENTRASTTGKAITNEISRAFAYPKAEVDLDTRTIGKQQKEQDFETGKIRQENLKTAGESLRADIARTWAGTALTAAQTARLEKMTDQLVALSLQAVESGEIDLDAQRNIAAFGGVEAGKLRPLMELIKDFISNRRSMRRGF